MKKCALGLENTSLVIWLSSSPTQTMRFLVMSHLFSYFFRMGRLYLGIYLSIYTYACSNTELK